MLLASLHALRSSPSDQGTHDENLEHVVKMLNDFAEGRFEIHRDYSVEAAAGFADEVRLGKHDPTPLPPQDELTTLSRLLCFSQSLDFVYIDARHDYDGCLEDIVAWYPKLKKGGLIAGHDFIPDQIKEKEGAFGVQRAAMEVRLLEQSDSSISHISITRTFSSSLRSSSITPIIFKRINFSSSLRFSPI